jgi:hypothetical protein
LSRTTAALTTLCERYASSWKLRITLQEIDVIIDRSNDIPVLYKIPRPYEHGGCE